MSDPQNDYLWDGSGPSDPDLAALERRLRVLAHDGRPLAAGRRGRSVLRRGRVLVALAGAALLAILVWASRDAGDVTLAPGAPGRTFVAAAAPRRIELGALAEVELRPGSELQFVHWREDQALFALQRGRIAVRVAPPPAVAPRFFQVDTALGRVIDEGCRYELAMLDGKEATVVVTEGGVRFAAGSRTVFVPVGASLRVDREHGPGTPRFGDADPRLVKAVAQWDRAMAADAPVDEIGKAYKELAMAIQQRNDPRDSLVLWHLLYCPHEFVRAAAEAELLALVGPPDGGRTKTGSWDPEEWLAFLRIGPWMQAR